MRCDFTSLTCERGYAVSGMRLYELLDSDRKTVVGHYFCAANTCFDFDQGVPCS